MRSGRSRGSKNGSRGEESSRFTGKTGGFRNRHAIRSVIPYRLCREDDWDRAIALAWRIRSKGLTVPWLGVLVAAIAIHDGVRLYATDAHFQEIAKHSGLRLYRPGYGGSFTDVDDG